MSTKILLVDDEALVLATFGKGLRNAGYDILFASNGKEALEVAENNNPDLAIVDIRMPGISGIDISKKLHEASIPVMHLTAYDDKATLDQALAQGALGYLIKPIDAVRAIPTIKTALERAKDMLRLRTAEDRLSKALDTANVVNFAVGILSERHRIGRQKAFELIRSQARSERRKVKEIANEILEASDIINHFGQEDPRPVLNSLA
tara:strand:+ start:210 stop:827 length:618 start_codon:yes stop_codon:yes gene_type:complete